MQLSILYRTHAGTNDKLRPHWFDRASALATMRLALDNADVATSFTFVSDGAMPAELEQSVRRDDQVVTISGGSAARSLRACLRVAVSLAERSPSDTVFWLAEDDYAYVPTAFTAVVAAAEECKKADYFALYVPDEPPWHDAHPSQPFRVLSTADHLRIFVEDNEWRRVRETTSSFGVRRDVLVEDAWMLRLGSMVGAPFDAATWVALQGVHPFANRHLLSDLDPYWHPRGLAKVFAKPVMRAALNAASYARVRSPRTLLAPRDDLAMHLEAQMIPGDSAWESLVRNAGS